jgi:hypothetical protein
MAVDYDYDNFSYIDLRSLSTTVISVTSSTLPNKDIVFIYRTSDGTTARVVCNSTVTPPTIDRFQQIILELEE